MKTDYIYWATFVKYLKDNFKLTDDITNNAKVIKETQYLWREASKRHLRNVKAKDMAEVWCDFDKKYYGDYRTWYEDFVEYVEYASDRMTVNRWLYAQMAINTAVDSVYERWLKDNRDKSWYLEIENGWSDNIKYSTKLEEDCANEFKNTIKPLIIQNQEKENQNQK